MRKLKLQMQTTIDGYISGINGEMDWVSSNWTEDIKQYVGQITDPVETIILGRNLAEGFIPYWTSALNQAEPQEGARKFVETPKVVFSKTIQKSPWENTVMANGELKEEINNLKNTEGKDIIVYGGGKLVSALVKENLIDELYLFINPAAIGKGISIFNALNNNQNYILKSSKHFECGIIVLVYSPK